MAYGIILTIVLIAIDRWTKHLATAYLMGGSTPVIIPKILGLRYARNTGMAFSMLSGKTVVLIGVTSVALLYLSYLIFIKKYGTKLERFFLLLILAGGIGNLIDRIFQGYVVDFFDFLFMNFAVFNMADVYVCVGIGLYFVYTVYTEIIRKGN